MQATVGASSMTLGGLLKHLAFMEDVYFSYRLLGRDIRSLWDAADFDDPDWEWHSATHDSPEELLTMWQDAVARSRAAVAELLTDGDLGQLVRFSGWDQPPSLRRILIDIIESTRATSVTRTSSGRRWTGSSHRILRADAGFLARSTASPAATAAA